jgi:hypothetical protein
MFSWEYNKKMLQMYMVDHAEDIGRFWAEIYLKSPEIYTNFTKGFYDEVNKNWKPIEPKDNQTEKKE